MRTLLEQLHRRYPRALIVGHHDLDPQKDCPCFDAVAEVQQPVLLIKQEDVSKKWHILLFYLILTCIFFKSLSALDEPVISS